MSFFAVAYAFHFLTLPMIYGGLVIISICAARVSGRAGVEHTLSARPRPGNQSDRGADRGGEHVEPDDAGDRRRALRFLGPLPALTINALTYLASQISLARIPSLGPDETAGLPTVRAFGRRRRARLPAALERPRHARASVRRVQLQHFRFRRLCDLDSVFEERLRCVAISRSASFSAFPRSEQSSAPRSPRAIRTAGRSDARSSSRTVRCAVLRAGRAGAEHLAGAAFFWGLQHDRELRDRANHRFSNARHAGRDGRPRDGRGALARAARAWRRAYCSSVGSPTTAPRTPR